MPTPHIRTALPGPKAQALLKRDFAVTTPSLPRDYPFVIEKGRGAEVWDVDGNRFLDFAAGIAVCSTGHAHPAVVQAIKDAADDFLHISSDYWHERLTSLAEKINALNPVGEPTMIFPCQSGTETVEAALKLARYVTGRPRFIGFLGGFHGRTMGSLAFTASKYTQQAGFFPTMPGVTHVPYPNVYRNCTGGAEEQAAYALSCARFIEEKLFRTTLPPEEVAAIVLEPIQGESGYVVAPSIFLEEIRRICDRHGILMIVDEVQSGMGRTGKWWAIEHSGVQPDIVTIAKGIASGMPLSVCMSKASIMDWVPGSHASTFGGNPVCLAAAMATMDVLERHAIHNAETVGNFMFERMQTWKKKHHMVGDVRGRGLMIGVEIVSDQTLKTPAPAERDAIIQRAFERGLLLLGAGENTIRLTPPLVISKSQATKAMNILEECLELRP